MKKILSLLCIVVSLTLAFALMGCANNDTFTAKSYCSDEIKIDKIVIDASDRQIDVEVSDDNQVHVDYFDGEKEYFDITVEDGKLYVKLMFNKKYSDFIGKKADDEYRKVKVKLPKNIIELSINTTNEDLNMTSLNVDGIVSVSNKGGDIKFDCVTVGETLNVEVKNGSIIGSIIGCWDDYSMQCKVKKGDCNLPAQKNSGNKSLKVDCNNGDVNIELINNK